MSRVVNEIENAKFHSIVKDRGICCHFVSQPHVKLFSKNLKRGIRVYLEVKALAPKCEDLVFEPQDTM